MSYRRSYHEIITVSGTAHKTVYYPASKDGGSMSVSVPYVENVPVNVNINVDTTPFDHSVNSCNNKIDLLTGAVVSTEAAQVVSIQENSKKVAKTIVYGFFDYIRSEISQQISELTQKIDAQILHLRELATSCVQKKGQMESDYNRIASRYQKIFEDLDKETSVRIKELDKPVFQLRERTVAIEKQVFSSSDVNTVSIHASESSSLRTIILTSSAKDRTSIALEKAKQFLIQQMAMNAGLKQKSINESIDKKYYFPVTCYEFKLDGQQTQMIVVPPKFLNDTQEKQVHDKVRQNWTSLLTDANSDMRVSSGITLLINEKYSNISDHQRRVRNEILRLVSINN
jgi:hypothetical protein